MESKLTSFFEEASHLDSFSPVCSSQYMCGDAWRDELNTAGSHY